MVDEVIVETEIHLFNHLRGDRIFSNEWQQKKINKTPPKHSQYRWCVPYH
jgi:hypothetical protein